MGEAEAPKRVGRPRIHAEDGRANITFQCGPALKQRLQARADADGSSLSRAIEDMLRERLDMADIRDILREEIRKAGLIEAPRHLSEHHDPYINQSAPPH